MHETHQVRTTFGSWDDEKAHAAVARSTFPSQNVQNTPGSDHVLKLWCRKSARRFGAKHMSTSKCTKHHLRSTFWSCDVEKAHAVEALSRFRSQKCKKWRVRSIFGRSDVVLRGRRKGLCTLSKVSNTWGFVEFPKTMAGVGHVKRIWQDAFSVAGAVQETCSSEMLGGPGADFLRGVACWSIRSSVLGRWFRVTGAALRMTWHHFFVAGTVI